MVAPLEIVYRPIADLIPYVRNSRTHSDAQIAQIAAYIREFGWTNPVLTDGQRGVIAGHGRILAARKLGIEQVPCIELAHMSAAQKRAYVIADNQLAANASWDLDMLRVEVGDLTTEGFDVSLLGFDSDFMESLMAPAVTEGITDPDEVPDVPRGEPASVPGDLWIMGRHRLVCGDCTVVDVIDRVMPEKKADLCLTDPPYGLGGKKDSGKNDYDDYVDSRENLEVLANDWLPLARELCDVVVFSPGVTNQWIYPEPNWVMCWFYGGGQLRSSWGFNCWQPFLCYGKDPSLASGNGGRPDAVDMNTPANAGDLDHPCPKPIKLWDWFLNRLVFKKGAVLFEPFSGSGTTIIAAESAGHCARAVEISPAYVDVAVKRWQNFTGKQAILDGDGRTFAEVEQGRRIGDRKDGSTAEAASAASA